MTLQKYLETNQITAHNQWSLSISGGGDKIQITIHPMGVSGETIDFTVIGNNLIEHKNTNLETRDDLARAIQYIMKYSHTCIDTDK